MVEHFNVAGYTRISVDDELDKDNTSIENQKEIIADFVQRKFPKSTLTFYEDRDKSGYTFEQRPSYQTMRKKLMSHQYDILIVKDFSRFSRRNSRGLVELEDLRDAGVRIISIGDGIDFPNDDDWLKIQFQFLINEMPVTDTSKKVKSVISRRQSNGKWICAVPYGYVLTSSKMMAFEVDEAAAKVVHTIFQLYNDGWGYKKIANYLTDNHIPTPRALEKERKEAKGEECRLQPKSAWSIATVQGILDNDFYIGTLRQGKFTRKKINGSDIRKEEADHIVFENHHTPIIDYRTWAITQELRKQRTTNHYRGIKRNENSYSGFLFCGDCGSPMFAMSRRDLRPAYTCGTYHRRGLSGCTSHHIRVDKLDELLKIYLRRIRDNSSYMMKQLQKDIDQEVDIVCESETSAENLGMILDGLREELKATKRQRIRDIMKHPENEALLEETYEEMEQDLSRRIEGIQNQIALINDRRNTVIQVNRVAKTAIDIFNDILEKEHLDKRDLALIVEQIIIFEDHIEVQLKADIDSLLSCGTLEDSANFKLDTGNIEISIVQDATKHLNKVFRVNVIREGDPSQITLMPMEKFCFSIISFSKRCKID